MSRKNPLNLASLLLGGLLGSLLAAPQSARADSIDDALGSFDGAQAIFSFLKDKGYKKVGVLRFQVKKGHGKATFHADTLNDLMATRLENALVFTQPSRESSQVVITRGATRRAFARDPKSTYLTPAGRARLFLHDYDPAWGSGKIKVDAFLTGVTEYSPDFKTIRIRVQLFDRASAGRAGDKAFTEVAVLSASADRSAWRDAGKAFVIRKRSFPFPDLDDPRKEKKRLDPSDIPGMEVDPDPFKAFMKENEFQVVMGDRWEGSKLINETPLNLIPAADGYDLSGTVPDKIIAFKIKAKSRMGLFLGVDGRNSVNLDEIKPEETPAVHSWWIMEPRAEYYYVRGFTQRVDAKTVKLKEFSVVLPEKLKREDFDPGERRGKFELAIFKDARDVLPTGTPFVERPPDPLRGDPGSLGSLAMVKEKLKRGLPGISRIYVIPGVERVVPIDTTEFNGILSTSVSIWYYRADDVK